MGLDDGTLTGAIESILLVADRPVALAHLIEVFQGEADKEAIQRALDGLVGMYRDRNFQLIEVAGGYRFATRAGYAEWVKRFLKVEKRSTLSRQAMETLSIIAYKQPITRVEVEEIRGVDSSGSIKTLLEKGLVKIVGRKRVVGRPLLYGSTKSFLEHFGLRDLSDLPPVEELRREFLKGPGGVEGASSEAVDEGPTQEGFDLKVDEELPGGA